LEPLIHIDEDKCKTCYACVRVCPVKALQVQREEEVPVLLASRCIGCGSCLSACAPQAISYTQNIRDAFTILEGNEQVVAITGPSISGEFSDITDYRKFVQMIRQLGFEYVVEASFGADLVALEYEKLLKNFRGKYYITANCPAVVNYVEKFHPSLINNLAPLISPMIATARVIRKKYGKKARIIYIGPCVAAKNEARLYEEAGIDAVLTFTELRAMFSEKNITESTLEFSDFDEPVGFKGSLFAISNGIVQAASLDEGLQEGRVITAEGKNDVSEALREFDRYIDDINRHFNLFYCNGCIMGPGTSQGGNRFLRRSLVVKYANKRLRDFNREEWVQKVKEYGDIDFNREFKDDDQRLPEPSPERILEILKTIGRDNQDDRLGCSACGYESCHEFAVAIGQGLATPEMCNTYALKNKQKYIKTLKKTNEKMASMQEALQASEKIARIEKEAAREASEINKTMLQKLRAGVVIVDKNLKILQSNERFIQILGSEAEEINEIVPGLAGADVKTLLPFTIYNLFNHVLTSNEDILSRDVHYGESLLNISIFTIRKNKIAGAVVRDMYLPEVQKEEVINRVTDVIDKNLEMVQKIGFLLGEGASETEKMLQSIIETYRNNKKS
jgi:iron only hydrogenase large subunit-like protein